MPIRSIRLESCQYRQTQMYSCERTARCAFNVTDEARVMKSKGEYRMEEKVERLRGDQRGRVEWVVLYEC